MKQVVIYKITSPSNKVYIGQSWDWVKRKSIYKRKACKNQVLIYNSLVKYGYEEHSFVILEEFDNIVSQNILNDKEIFWWKYYKNIGHTMLNIKYPGSYGRLSQDTKDKLSKALSGRIIKQESIDKGLATRKITNYKHSQETKDKIGKKHKGKIMSIEAREKIKLSLLGNKQSLETIEKRRQSHLGKKISEETKRKISESKKGNNYGKTGIFSHQSKKVINIVTNEVFSSAKESEVFYNLKKNTLSPKLRGKINNNTNLRYLENVCS